MPYASATIIIEPLGAEVGWWCNDCLLPSGVNFTFAMRIGTSLDSINQDIVCCDCGGRDLSPPE